MRIALSARRSPRARCLAAIAVLLAGLSASASSVAATYTCADPVTRAVTASEKPCADAGALSPAEAAADAEARRKAAIADDGRAAAARIDRQMLAQFPDETAHRTAEFGQLQGVAAQIDEGVQRLAQLLAERRTLDAELEFYKGRTVPNALQTKLDASDGRLAGLTLAFVRHQADVAFIAQRFAHQRAHLVRLWAGARPGSSGLYAPPASASATALR
jgi:hypothetical protein